MLLSLFIIIPYLYGIAQSLYSRIYLFCLSQYFKTVCFQGIYNITEKDEADVLGDGWTVPVIAYIFIFMK